MNSKKEQNNSEATNLETEGPIEEQQDKNYINEATGDNKPDEKSIHI